MVYMDYSDIGWRPYISSWIQNKENSALSSNLIQLVEKYLPPILKFRYQCTDIVQVHESSIVRSITIFFDTLVAIENTDLSTDKLVEMWFLFSIIWAVGGPFKEESRRKFDMFLREID
ncbi:Dynein heavy chain 2, axonemal, partial [Coelomomyces lativittatus]